MAPILLPANQPPNRFYKGGGQISSFRSSESPSTDPNPEYQPEDWVASTTCCHGSHPLGLSPLPSGELLADAVAADPISWLGQDHVRAFGTTTKLLVKLLDAGQRLAIHAHPHDDWARRCLGVEFGKAEAWYILTPGTVHLGLKQDVGMDALLQMVQAQNTDAMLSMMHRVDLTPGQTVYVPPGLLHALGEGILLVEVQEPSDLSIMLEWQGFEIDGANKGHLGVGWETALTAVESRARTEQEIQGLIMDGKVASKTAGRSVFAAPSDEYFQMERIAVQGQELGVKRGFAVMIVLQGSLELTTKSHESLRLQKGNTVVVPYSDGDFNLSGDGEVLVARPPLLKP